MKKYLFIFLATALFASCDDDVTRDPSPVTPEDCQDVYFPADNPASAELAPDDNQFTLSVTRTEFTQEANVPIHVSTTAPEAFTIPETVHFAAGQEEAELVIGTEQMKPFVTYQLTITVDEAFADYYTERPYGTAVYTLKLMKSDWAVVDEGVMTCPLFKNPWRQSLEYSAILDQYRFPEAWGEDDFTFTWDKGAEFHPVGIENGNQIQFYIGDYEPGAPMYFLCAKTCPYDAATKTFTIVADWYVGGGYGNQGSMNSTVKMN
ncbi:hypothetical protein [Alistipes sp.]|uniref:hypothetical protein n=1 Tax=Alistipes sp. TaxID=1872444 RepID=UPI003AF1471C